MLKNLFNQNPLLKVLIPLLLVCAIGLLFIQQIKPQLAYRAELRAEVAALNKELNDIRKVATSISSEDKEKMEVQLKTMRDNLGLSLYSPELVQILEERAKQTRIEISNYTFAEITSKNDLQERKLKLIVQGKFTAILDFQKSLEEFSPFTGTETIDILPIGSAQDNQEITATGLLSGLVTPEGAVPATVPDITGNYNGEDLVAELTIGFSAVPEPYPQSEVSSLPIREHPFR